MRREGSFRNEQWIYQSSSSWLVSVKIYVRLSSTERLNNCTAQIKQRNRLDIALVITRTQLGYSMVIKNRKHMRFLTCFLSPLSLGHILTISFNCSSHLSCSNKKHEERQKCPKVKRTAHQLEKRYNTKDPFQAKRIIWRLFFYEFPTLGSFGF